MVKIMEKKERCKVSRKRIEIARIYDKIILFYP